MFVFSSKWRKCYHRLSCSCSPIENWVVFCRQKQFLQIWVNFCNLRPTFPGCERFLRRLSKRHFLRTSIFFNFYGLPFFYTKKWFICKQILCLYLCFLPWRPFSHYALLMQIPFFFSFEEKMWKIDIIGVIFETKGFF